MYRKFSKENKELILKLAAEEFNCTVDNILAVDRTSRSSNARHVAMAVIKLMLDSTLQEVGTYFGKHYTTIIHAKKRVDDDKRLLSIASSIVKKYKEHKDQE